MTDADLQLAQLFHAAEEPKTDPGFADRIMRRLAVERRKAFGLRLVLQAAALVVIMTLTWVIPTVLDSFRFADFGGMGSAFLTVICLVIAGGVAGRPLLARSRA